MTLHTFNQIIFLLLKQNNLVTVNRMQLKFILGWWFFCWIWIYFSNYLTFNPNFYLSQSTKHHYDYTNNVTPNNGWTNTRTISKINSIDKGKWNWVQRTKNICFPLSWIFFSVKWFCSEINTQSYGLGLNG